ncbi:hypothetical protein [Pectinatus haikarae]|uniref:DNA polymerase III sliding clamp (Beta) subunit (PCNA family) n=1 Tax=Pectinatus haikarae TaxID=349096 RepID=A0ABT9Y3U9_9FIRM|nr:hypothetical protein [Pectinatus haikarae]MDQ0202504.1 DNA polymerase III sliding clamp (beta) subunit (PCNA family) [Pectinatus haikarae]
MLTVFMKHAKNFVSKDLSRPIFNSIMFDGEYAIATNTHICVAVPFKSEKRIINYKTGIDIEGEIPDYKSCIPTKIEYTARINKIDLPTFIKPLKIIKAMYQTWQHDVIEFTAHGITAHPKIDYDGVYTACFDNIEGQFSAGMSLSSKYLLDILSFFNDLEDAAVQKVVLEFAGNNKPLKISAKCGAFALITPLRKIKE